jgi:putative copper export protein
LNENFVGGPFDNVWSELILAKHAVVTVMVLLAIYSFEVLAPKVAKLAAKGPSQELLKAQKLQLRLTSTGFVLGLVVLLLIAIVLSL